MCLQRGHWCHTPHLVAKYYERLAVEEEVFLAIYLEEMIKTVKKVVHNFLLA
jgi:hypothetical protein